MHYIIYKTTNTINNKIYIGQHKTEKLDDGYLGSGTKLREDIKLFGTKFFEREILFECNDSDEMDLLEAKLVDFDFVCRSDTYNRCVGGQGANWHESMEAGGNLYYDDNGNVLNGQDGRGKQNLLCGAELVNVLKESGKYEQWCLNISEGLKGNTFWLGKQHTDETKRKIGLVTSKAQKGSGNSQFGKCWIHSLEEKVSKSIHKTDLEDYLSKGWIKGRKMKF